jgi:hypothetical protein
MLKTIYDTKDEIPVGYEDLYTEKNGKWELTGVIGVKTQADIDRVQGALVKERTEHRATKAAFAPFEGLDAETIATQAHDLEEANAQLAALKSDGSIDETKLEPIIAARVAQKVAPIEREKNALGRKLSDSEKLVAAAQTEVAGLKTTIVMGNVERAIRDAAIGAKVLPSAIDDAVMRGLRIFEISEDDHRIITKDGVGVTAGLTPKDWFHDMEERAPHWWPASVGSGSGPLGRNGPNSGYAGANNPWSKEGWNVTKQGHLVKTLGEVKANEIAGQVGCVVGSTKAAA